TRKDQIISCRRQRDLIEVSYFVIDTIGEAGCCSLSPSFADRPIRQVDRVDLLGKSQRQAIVIKAAEPASQHQGASRIGANAARKPGDRINAGLPADTVIP